MKPGNRHESEMVPSHAKLALWRMREWISVDKTMTLSVFAQKGSFCIHRTNLERRRHAYDSIIQSFKRIHD